MLRESEIFIIYPLKEKHFRKINWRQVFYSGEIRAPKQSIRLSLYSEPFYYVWYVVVSRITSTFQATLHWELAITLVTNIATELWRTASVITLLLKHFPLFSFFSFNPQSYTSQPKQYVNYRKHNINTLPSISISLSFIHLSVNPPIHPSAGLSQPCL